MSRFFLSLLALALAACEPPTWEHDQEVCGYYIRWGAQTPDLPGFCRLIVEVEARASMSLQRGRKIEFIADGSGPYYCEGSNAEACWQRDHFGGVAYVEARQDIRKTRVGHELIHADLEDAGWFNGDHLHEAEVWTRYLAYEQEVANDG